MEFLGNDKEFDWSRYGVSIFPMHYNDPAQNAQDTRINMQSSDGFAYTPYTPPFPPQTIASIPHFGSPDTILSGTTLPASSSDEPTSPVAPWYLEPPRPVTSVGSLVSAGSGSGTHPYPKSTLIHSPGFWSRAKAMIQISFKTKGHKSRRNKHRPYMLPCPAPHPIWCSTSGASTSFDQSTKSTQPPSTLNSQPATPNSLTSNITSSSGEEYLSDGEFEDDSCPELILFHRQSLCVYTVMRCFHSVLGQALSSSCEEETGVSTPEKSGFPVGGQAPDNGRDGGKQGSRKGKKKGNIIWSWRRLASKTYVEATDDDGSNGSGGSRGDAACQNRGTDAAERGSSRKPGHWKRKRASRDESGDDGDDEQQQPGSPSSPEEKKMFSCIFYKKNPVKYHRDGVGACKGPGFPTVHRMKEHLFRYHKIPIHCPRCRQVFRHHSPKDTHYMQREPCEIKDSPTFEGLTEDQVTFLRIRKKKKEGWSDADIWKEAYRIAFPEVLPEHVPSPYHEAMSTALLQDRGRDTYHHYLRQELPAVVCSHVTRRLRECSDIMDVDSSDASSSANSGSGLAEPTRVATTESLLAILRDLPDFVETAVLEVYGRYKQATGESGSVPIMEGTITRHSPLPQTERTKQQAGHQQSDMGYLGSSSNTADPLASPIPPAFSLEPMIVAGSARPSQRLPGTATPLHTTAQTTSAWTVALPAPLEHNNKVSGTFRHTFAGMGLEAVLDNPPPHVDELNEVGHGRPQSVVVAVLSSVNCGEAPHSPNEVSANCDCNPLFTQQGNEAPGRLAQASWLPSRRLCAAEQFGSLSFERKPLPLRVVANQPEMDYLHISPCVSNSDSVDSGYSEPKHSRHHPNTTPSISSTIELGLRQPTSAEAYTNSIPQYQPPSPHYNAAQFVSDHVYPPSFAALQHVGGFLQNWRAPAGHFLGSEPHCPSIDSEFEVSPSLPVDLLDFAETTPGSEQAGIPNTAVEDEFDLSFSNATSTTSSSTKSSGTIFKSQRDGDSLTPTSSSSPFSSTSSGEDSSFLSEEDDDLEGELNLLQRYQPHVDVVMREFYKTFKDVICHFGNAGNATLRNRAGCNQPQGEGQASVADSRPSQSNRGSESGGKKRKHSNDGDDLNERDERPERRRKLESSGAGRDMEPGPLFACIFYKKYPVKYHRDGSGACSGPGFPTIHRLKEHLFRYHRVPVHCPRCRKVFKLHGERDNHLQQEPCEIKKAPAFDGLNEDQVTLLKVRKRKSDRRPEGDIWREAFRIVFPEVLPENIPSPYHEVLDPTTIQNATVRSYTDYLRDELPSQVCTRIQHRLRTNRENSDLDDDTLSVDDLVLSIYTPEIMEQLSAAVQSALEETSQQYLHANPLQPSADESRIAGIQRQLSTIMATGDGSASNSAVGPTRTPVQHVDTPQITQEQVELISREIGNAFNTMTYQPQPFPSDSDPLSTRNSASSNLLAPEPGMAVLQVGDTGNIAYGCDFPMH
ncbi:uncharacterized protein MKZ38_000835 [Zalerion maritima]|uniref:C2H2-type domain-containing protein n=1 Tax=Zalerion maritima TaxID=339359 RepID=A0AAD5WTH5_9PEZI|nr:uncharacterized protein MKZ38_000835 [Zalerion maritima]